MTKTSAILRDNVSEIMELWQNKVKEKVPAAKSANAVALYDHLPNIIEDIADILERLDNVDDIDSDRKYLELVENSKHHGRHRAATTNYTVEQVVHEYIIFHRTLTKFLKSHDVYNEQIADLLKYVIETSVLKSVGSFSQSIQEMQEKLIGTLAHDIRSPLSAAQMSLEMLELDDTQEWRSQMEGAAVRSVRKAISLVEGLMNGITVRAGEGMLLNFDNHNIVEDIRFVFDEAKEMYAHKIILVCPTELINGVFDTIAIRRLIENLIGNAVKYGSHKHPITITVENRDDQVQIRVHNEGTPISIEKQQHIFDFLGREDQGSNSVRKSWGMGLTLAQIVAEAHGGDIKLESAEKQGTTFIVTLLKRFNTPGKKRTKLTFVEAHN